MARLAGPTRALGLPSFGSNPPVADGAGDGVFWRNRQSGPCQLLTRDLELFGQSDHFRPPRGLCAKAGDGPSSGAVARALLRDYLVRVEGVILADGAIQRKQKVRWWPVGFEELVSLHFGQTRQYLV